MHAATARTPRRACERIDELHPLTHARSTELPFSPRRRLRRPAASPAMTPSPREYNTTASTMEAISAVLPDSISSSNDSFTAHALPPLRPSHRRSDPAQAQVVLSPPRTLVEPLAVAATPAPQDTALKEPPKQPLSWASSLADLEELEPRMRSDPTNATNERLHQTRRATADFDEISFNIEDIDANSHKDEWLNRVISRLSHTTSSKPVHCRVRGVHIEHFAFEEPPPLPPRPRSSYALAVKVEIQQEQPAWAMVGELSILSFSHTLISPFFIPLLQTSPTLRLNSAGRVSLAHPPRPHMRSVSATSQNTLARFSEASYDVTLAVNEWVAELRTPHDQSSRRIFGPPPRHVHGIAPPALRHRYASSSTDVQKPPLRKPVRGQPTFTSKPSQPAAKPPPCKTRRPHYNSLKYISLSLSHSHIAALLGPLGGSSHSGGQMCQ